MLRRRLKGLQYGRGTKKRSTNCPFPRSRLGVAWSRGACF